MEEVDCVVVGAGVVGLAVARALADLGADVVISTFAAVVGTGTVLTFAGGEQITLANFTGLTAATTLAGRCRGRFALAIGSLVFLGAVSNFYLLPHPMWLIVLSLIMIPLVAVLCWWALKKRCGHPVVATEGDGK